MKMSLRSTIGNLEYGVSQLRRSIYFHIFTLPRMKESRILVVNLSNVCTEAARHLALSGINLELLDHQPDLLVEEHHA